MCNSLTYKQAVCWETLKSNRCSGDQCWNILRDHHAAIKPEVDTQDCSCNLCAFLCHWYQVTSYHRKLIFVQHAISVEVAEFPDLQHTGTLLTLLLSVHHYKTLVLTCSAPESLDSLQILTSSLIYFLPHWLLFSHLSFTSCIVWFCCWNFNSNITTYTIIVITTSAFDTWYRLFEWNTPAQIVHDASLLFS